MRLLSTVLAVNIDHVYRLHDNEFNPPGGPLQLEQVLDGHLCEGVRAVHLYVYVVVRK